MEPIWSAVLRSLRQQCVCVCVCVIKTKVGLKVQVLNKAVSFCL